MADKASRPNLEDHITAWRDHLEFSRRSSLRLVSAAEVPPDPDRGVEAVRANPSKVRQAQMARVTAHPIYGMLRHAEFEVPGKLDAHAEQVFIGDRCERVGVAELGHVVSERRSWGREEKHVTQRSAAERLRLHIAAEHVAREIGAQRVSASILTGRWAAAPEI